MTSSLQTEPYDTRFTAPQYPYAVFGILGSFAGDADLERELEWCRQAFQSASSDPKPRLARLVRLLESLPLKGRNAVVRQILAPSPDRDVILRDLFDYCFQPDDDDDNEDISSKASSSFSSIDVVDEEFVLIANSAAEPSPTNDDPPKPLNLNRFHVFQVVLVLMALSGPAGGDASRRYLRSASTRYRAKVLIQCVTSLSNQDFSDQDLWQFYHSSPDAVQHKVIDACKQSGRRQDFLRRVYEEDDTSTSLIFWLDSDYLAGKLEKLMDDKKSLKMKRWGEHGEVYIDYCRKKLEECGKDVLKRGKVWKALQSRMELNSIKSSHVYALLELLEMYKAYEVDYHTIGSREAREYLEDLSSQDEDVSLFDGVKRVRLDTSVVSKLTKHERLQLVLKTFENRDWDSFSALHGLVPPHKLPYKDVYSQATSNDLWALLAGQTVDDFFSFFSQPSLADEAPSHIVVDISRSWADLHLRLKPSDLSAEQLFKYCPGKPERVLWEMWYKSYASFYNVETRHLNSAIGSKEILDIAIQGLRATSMKLTTDVALTPVFPLLEGSSNDTLSKLYNTKAKSFAQQQLKAILNDVIPQLGSMMQFDPTSRDTYITQDILYFFSNALEYTLSQWASYEQIAHGAASMLLDVISRASEKKDGSATKSPGFNVTTDVSTSRRHFVYLNSYLHERTVETCLKYMKEILRMMKTHQFGLSVSKQLWSEVVERQSRMAVYEYLDTCSLYLPSDLFADEKSSMIEKSKGFILSTYKKSPHSWKDGLSPVADKLKNLGLLEAVVSEDGIPEKVRNSLLRDHAGFGNENVRQALKDATFEADGQSRAEGIVAWLSEACKTDSMSLIAEAMSFAASRVKNEAGSHRRTVFSWLEDNFVRQVVQASLEDVGEELNVHEKLCSVILLMQKNDLSRLDSVSRFVCFPRLPRHILDAVFNFDPLRLNKERRQLWTNCAIRLHWTLEEAASGDESLRCYTWPITHGEVLKSASWISPDHLVSAYPPSTESSTRLSKLSQCIDISDNLCEELNQEKIFGPSQCVEMLEKAIRAVWVEDFPCDPVRIEGSFPDDKDTADALQKRISVLLELSGTAWQEVELLTSNFDNIFSNLETATESHFYHASQILELLVSIHGQPGAFEVPRLARACDMVFRYAVTNEKSTHIKHWHGYWQTLFLEKGSCAWDSISDDRLRYFLLHYAQDCEPVSCHSLFAKTDKALRKCVMVRELLAMSPSALLLKEVREILLASRQDVFVRYSKDPDLLKGPFTCFGRYDGIDALLFKTLEKESLLSCPADISKRHANFALTEATNSQLNLRSKMRAIAEFMAAPSTHHLDVLAALQSPLQDAVREALINRVFSLDSPWYILGFLLNQESIEKNDQRITAALLGYVAQHVHVDKVVQVVELLLKKPRRKKLSYQLHKGVIRMLFDAKTDDGMRLLQAEWEGDLPNGVRNLIVERCMCVVLSGETEGWEASVLSQVATDKSLEPETKFCLFSPRWMNFDTGALTIPVADGVETDELLDQYRQKGPAPISTNSERVADRVYAVFEELEKSSDGSLQLLAKCKKLSLSHLFGPVPRDDQGALLDMLQFLTTSLEPDHKHQFGLYFLSNLFAAGVCSCLNLALSKQKMSQDQKQIAQVCDQSDVAEKLRVCVRTKLNEVLDTPIRQVRQRQQVLKSLNALLTTTKRYCDQYDVLLAKPFKSELDLLKKDVSLVRKMCQLEALSE